MSNNSKAVLVVGGGISGISSALELAEMGQEVVLVEKEPFLGGRVAAFNSYFPKLCPPTCGLEINFKRMKKTPNLQVYTMAEVEKISGGPGNYQVTLQVKPRYVNERCTACGQCAEVCTTERENSFNLGMDKSKAIYFNGPHAYPPYYVLEKDLCDEAECKKLVEACDYEAIDLEMKTETIELSVKSVIWATGWKPYDAKKVEYLGFGSSPDILTNVMMERLTSNSGPTKGKIVRPSNGEEVKSVAFVQCAGSRDENHLPYCSGVCCLASLKQVSAVREQYPEAKIYVFFIDLRAGKYEDFYVSVQEDDANLSLIKGKVANVYPHAESGQLTVQAEDVEAGKLMKVDVDLVVLATGMVPNTVEEKVPLEGTTYDEFGFLVPNGIQAVGCVKKPLDVASSVQDATGASMKALQIIRGR